MGAGMSAAFCKLAFWSWCEFATHLFAPVWPDLHVVSARVYQGIQLTQGWSPYSFSIFCLIHVLHGSIFFTSVDWHTQEPTYARVPFCISRTLLATLFFALSRSLTLSTQLSWAKTLPFTEWFLFGEFIRSGVSGLAILFTKTNLSTRFEWQIRSALNLKWGCCTSDETAWDSGILGEVGEVWCCQQQGQWCLRQGDSDIAAGEA